MSDVKAEEMQMVEQRRNDIVVALVKEQSTQIAALTADRDRLRKVCERGVEVCEDTYVKALLECALAGDANGAS